MPHRQFSGFITPCLQQLVNTFKTTYIISFYHKEIQTQTPWFFAYNILEGFQCTCCFSKTTSSSNLLDLIFNTNCCHKANKSSSVLHYYHLGLQGTNNQKRDERHSTRFPKRLARNVVPACSCTSIRRISTFSMHMRCNKFV